MTSEKKDGGGKLNAVLALIPRGLGDMTIGAARDETKIIEFRKKVS